MAYATSAFADCSIQSAAIRPHLVELYTSEGCSSCPPADAWLRHLPQGSDTVALAFHVDYWDSLGWRDRFADPRFTLRQQAQAEHEGGTSVYTPQVVVDGRSWRNWYGGGALPPPQASSAAIKLTATGSAEGLRVHITTMAGDADGSMYSNYIAVTEDGLSSQVRAGENRGVLLRHDHVVRAWVGPLALDGADASIAVPEDLDWARANLVAFAQRASDGAVAQVVTVPLAQCR